MTDAVTRALDGLFATGPAKFAARRTELVRTLRASGEVAAAKAIAARKKPTQAAYLLNQLARRAARELEELSDVGRTLVRAQRNAYRTGGAESGLRESLADQRRIVGDLVRAALALATELEVTVSRHDLTRAFQAAIADPAVASALEAGMLASLPESSGELDVLAQSAAGARARPQVVHTPAAPKPDAKAERDAEAKRKSEEKAAAQSAREAERERAKREVERERALQRADALASRAKDAAKRATMLEASAARAATEATRARQQADALAREASELRERTTAGRAVVSTSRS